VWVANILIIIFFGFTSQDIKKEKTEIECMQREERNEMCK